MAMVQSIVVFVSAIVCSRLYKPVLYVLLRRSHTIVATQWLSISVDYSSGIGIKCDQFDPAGTYMCCVSGFDLGRMAI